MAKRKSSNPRYKGERITNLVSVRGRKTRFVEWYNPRVGRKTEFACAFQVCIRDTWFEICRYDSDHGTFHRHAPGWPEPKARDLAFPGVSMAERGETALEDISRNMEQWITMVPEEEFDESAS